MDEAQPGEHPADGPDGGGPGDEGCQFPTGPGGQLCGRARERTGGPGQPTRYCDLPEHTRARAFAARRALERARAGGVIATAEDDALSGADRPVSAGRDALGALLARFADTADAAQRAAAEHQAQLAAIAERVTTVVGTVADPDALAYELEQLDRETSVKVAEAVSLQAGAERLAREQHRAAERESELRAQADAAAEDALTQADALRAETAETLARVTAETDTAIAAQRERAEQADAARDEALAELARIRDEAAAAVATARDEASAAVAVAREEADVHRRDTIAETERLLGERDAEHRRLLEAAQARADEQVAAAERAAETARTAARTDIAAAQQQAAAATAAAEARAAGEIATAQQAIEDAQGQARTEILAAQQQAADATAAQTRAEADRAAAERRATEDRATLERTRTELETLRATHRDDLALVRREAGEERAALRREAAEQLAAVLARFDTRTESGRGEPADAGGTPTRPKSRRPGSRSTRTDTIDTTAAADPGSGGTGPSS